MNDLIDNGGYRFWKDDFSLQSAYEDCKGVFDGITNDDSFQECDTGLILYHAYEIMYALKKALLTAQQELRWIPVTERLPNREEYIQCNGLFIVSDENRAYAEYFDIYDKKCFGEHTMYGFRADMAVTAWMPLPKPYKEES